MVAAAGIGKAATTVADKATATTAKSASKEQVGRFDAAMHKPDQGSAAASSAAGQANQAGAVAGNAATQGGAPVAPAADAGKVTPGGGPGDRILGGIDKMRNTAKNLADGPPAASSGTPAASETGDPNLFGNVGKMMETQKSLIGFEVSTQVGGKGVQETNQAVQTLLKGQ